jgi:PKD repeat protein
MGVSGHGPLQISNVFQPEQSFETTEAHLTVAQAPHSARVFKIVDKTIPAAGPTLRVTAPALAVTAEAVPLSAETESGGVPALSYHWAFGDGTTADGPSVIHAYTKPGNYQVQLVVEGVDGVMTNKILPITVRGSLQIKFSPQLKKRLE